MAQEKLSEEEQVTAFIKLLDKPFGNTIEALRKIILSADPCISEQIKWNSPSFYYSGEMKPFNPKEYKRDIVVLNLRNQKILLVFPTGAKIKEEAGLLEGKYTDGRRIIQFKDLTDIQKKEKQLVKILKAWLALVEK